MDPNLAPWAELGVIGAFIGTYLYLIRITLPKIHEEHRAVIVKLQDECRVERKELVDAFRAEMGEERELFREALRQIASGGRG